MRMIVKNILLMTLLVGLLSACGAGRYAMREIDMYKGPDLNTVPQTVTVIFPILPAVNDIVSYDPRIIAWEMRIWDEKGAEESILALRIGFRDNYGRKRLVAVYPHPKASLVGKRVAVIGHCGFFIFNLAGRRRELSQSLSGRIKLEKYKDFLKPIAVDSPFVTELKKDSAEFVDLANLYKNFWQIVLDREASEYGYAQMVSSLSEEELHQLAKKSSRTREFLSWLGEDWKLIFTIPVLPPQELAANMIVAKIFTLPKLWAREVNRLGCLQSQVRAEDVARMVLYGISEYGRTRTGGEK